MNKEKYVPFGPHTPPSPPTWTQTPLTPLPRTPSSVTGASEGTPFGIQSSGAPRTRTLCGEGDLYPLATIGIPLVPICVGYDSYLPASSGHIGVVPTHWCGWGVL